MFLKTLSAIAALFLKTSVAWPLYIHTYPLFKHDRTLLCLQPAVLLPQKCFEIREAIRQRVVNKGWIKWALEGGRVAWKPKMHDDVMLNGVLRICLWLVAGQPIEKTIYDQREISLRLFVWSARAARDKIINSLRENNYEERNDWSGSTHLHITSLLFTFCFTVRWSYLLLQELLPLNLFLLFVLNESVTPFGN